MPFMKSKALPTKPHPTGIHELRTLAVAAGCSLPSLRMLLAGGSPSEMRTRRAKAALVSLGYLRGSVAVDVDKHAAFVAAAHIVCTPAVLGEILAEMRRVTIN